MTIGKTEVVLYLGPVRVETRVVFIGGLLVLKDLGRQTTLGYLNLFRGTCVVEYSLRGLNPHLQAAFRSPKTCNQWTTYMVYGNNIWTGKIEYLWGERDSVWGHLIRRS